MANINSNTIAIGIAKGWCLLQTIALLSFCVLAIWCLACQLLFLSQTTTTPQPGFQFPPATIKPLQFPTPIK